MITELDNPFDQLKRVFAYSLPLRRKFRRITVREGLLFEGEAGWGEAAPFWDYDAQESSRWLRAGLAAATTAFPAAKREQVPVNVTIPVTEPEVAAQLVKESGGCTTAKVKVADPGSTLRGDCERVAAVASALGPQGKVRVDANAAWDADQAVKAITELQAAVRDGGIDGLEYVEQPCPTVSELAQVRRQVESKIAADESIRRAEDPLAVARAGAADVAVVKVAPLGGIDRAVEVAHESGLELVISSALDSSVGISAGVAAAAALDHLDHACGLATVALFERDVTKESLLPTAGMLPLRRIEVDTTQAQDAPDLAARWHKRLKEMMRY